MTRCFSAATPAFALRGVHLDLKGAPPTFDRLLRLVDVFAAARFNVLLIEWEDVFPWTVDPAFRGETTYTPRQVRQLVQHAADAGLEVMPLVQCLGHMETPLSLPAYAHLREQPDRCDVINPLAPGAAQLIMDMIDDVLALCPDVRYFHLGGDEAWCFGTHPDTQSYIREHGKNGLYLHHLQPLFDHLNQRAIRPVLWHDMLIRWSADQLASVAEQADVMVWGYNDHPDKISDRHHYQRRHIDHLHQSGCTLWCAGAFKGADGMSADAPNFNARQTNLLGWLDVHQSLNFAGAVTTGWSRYSTHTLQTSPIDGALDTLVDAGHIFHDGRPMPDGRAGCEAFLQTLGEASRHLSCRQALLDLAEARRSGWANVIELHELVAMMQHDPHRQAGASRQTRMTHLQMHIDEARAAGAALGKALDGAVDSAWIDRYISERITPLETQHAQLAQQLTALAAAAGLPNAYDAAPTLDCAEI